MSPEAIGYNHEPALRIVAGIVTGRSSRSWQEGIRHLWRQSKAIGQTHSARLSSQDRTCLSGARLASTGLTCASAGERASAPR